MVLRFFGRKTGRRYDVPVVAHRLDGELYALTDAVWRNNFRGGADVEVTLDGHVTRMWGQLLDDPEAVAPLYAGLFAAFGTKLGFVTPTLWANHLCFNDITEGDNGFYRARIGPDPCTGIGSPIGTKLAALLAASAVPTSTHGQRPDSVPTDWSGTITYTYASGELVSTSKLRGRSRIRVKR